MDEFGILYFLTHLHQLEHNDIYSHPVDLTEGGDIPTDFKRELYPFEKRERFPKPIKEDDFNEDN